MVDFCGFSSHIRCNRHWTSSSRYRQRIVPWSWVSSWPCGGSTSSWWFQCCSLSSSIETGQNFLSSIWNVRLRWWNGRRLRWWIRTLNISTATISFIIEVNVLSTLIKHKTLSIFFTGFGSIHSCRINTFEFLSALTIVHPLLHQHWTQAWLILQFHQCIYDHGQLSL